MAIGSRIWTGVFETSAKDFSTSKAVVARMLLHLGIDMFVGVLPVIGDIADFFYKANEKNLALLEERLNEPKRDAIGNAVDWAYLIGSIGAVVGLLGLAIYGCIRLVEAIV